MNRKAPKAGSQVEHVPYQPPGRFEYSRGYGVYREQKTPATFPRKAVAKVAKPKGGRQ